MSDRQTGVVQTPPLLSLMDGVELKPPLRPLLSAIKKELIVPVLTDSQITALISLVIKVGEAIDITLEETFTKGDHGLVGNGFPVDQVRAFANKYEMSVADAQRFIELVAHIPEEFEFLCDLYSSFCDGAKANGLDIPTYARQYLKGLGQIIPGRA